MSFGGGIARPIEATVEARVVVGVDVEDEEEELANRFNNRKFAAAICDNFASLIRPNVAKCLCR